MICEQCGEETYITDVAKFKRIVIRHRRCKKCRHDFFTVEQKTDDYYKAKNLLLQKRYDKKNRREQRKAVNVQRIDAERREDE